MALKIDDLNLITGSDLVSFPTLEKPEPEMVPLVEMENISVFTQEESTPKYLKDFKYEEIGDGSFIFNADCYELLKTLPDNVISAVLTDPPYGYSFMNKEWDHEVPPVKIWKEVLRVLKPGGYLLSFGGTRTYHRMASNVEDAGFIIKDMIGWIYGQGFPKNHQVADVPIEQREGNIVYQKIGTSLKPAMEPVILAMAPLSSDSHTENFLKWGTGGLNIDATRIPINDKRQYSANMNGNQRTLKVEGTKLGLFEGGWKVDKTQKEIPKGRWPANIIFDEKAAQLLDEQTGVLKSGYMNSNHKRHTDGSPNGIYGKFNPNHELAETYGDIGGASRFFYCAKASKKEKEQGLDSFEQNSLRNQQGGSRDFNARCGNCGKKFIGDPKYICSCENPITDNNVFALRNNHTTVKPIELMKYLISLISPIQDSLILDCYFGSGTTGCAVLEHELRNLKFIGIEKDEHYYNIAVARCKAAVERTKNKIK